MNKTLPVLFFFMVMLSGCVEHFISINVHPDGAYTLEIISRGDSTDIFDDDFPHPAGGKRWSQHIWSDRTDKDTTWIMETRGYIERDMKLMSSDEELGALIHPLSIEIKNRWISTLYITRYIFKGREIYRKYPRLGETLEKTASSDSIEWTTEALVFIVSSALNDMKKNPKNELTSFLIERMTTHVRNYTERVKSKKLVIELSDKRAEFLRKLFNPFKNDVKSSFYENLDDAMFPYEEELRITTGLQDDRFSFHLTLPGLVTRSNADTLSGDTLKWTFELGDFAGDDYIMEAISVVYKTKEIQKISIIVILFGLFGWFFLWITVFRKT